MSNAEVTEEDKAAAVVAFRRLLGFDPMPLLSKSDSAVMQILQEFHAQARAAGRREGVTIALRSLKGPPERFACIRPQELARGLAAARDTLRTILDGSIEDAIADINREGSDK